MNNPSSSTRSTRSCSEYYRTTRHSGSSSPPDSMLPYLSLPFPIPLHGGQPLPLLSTGVVRTAANEESPIHRPVQPTALFPEQELQRRSLRDILTDALAMLDEDDDVFGDPVARNSISGDYSGAAEKGKTTQDRQ